MLDKTRCSIITSPEKGFRQISDEAAKAILANWLTLACLLEPKLYLHNHKGYFVLWGIRLNGVKCDNEDSLPHAVAEVTLCREHKLPLAAHLIDAPSSINQPTFIATNSYFVTIEETDYHYLWYPSEKRTVSGIKDVVDKLANSILVIFNDF